MKERTPRISQSKEDQLVLRPEDKSKMAVALNALSSRKDLRDYYFELTKKAIEGDQGALRVVLPFARELDTLIARVEGQEAILYEYDKGKTIAPTERDWYAIGMVRVALGFRKDVQFYYEGLVMQAVEGNRLAFRSILPIALALQTIIVSKLVYKQ